MEKLSFDDYSRITPESVVNLKRDSIAEGEPVFKVVDRTRWYMVCFVEAEHKDRYEEGQEINVEFEDETVSASVRSIKKTGDKVRIILETDHYYDKFAQARVSEVSLVTYEKRGLIIENASIGSEKGVQGVYVRNKTNEYVFVPIQVKATDGKYSLIADTTFYDEKGELYSTVEIYDEILKEPK